MGFIIFFVLVLTWTWWVSLLLRLILFLTPKSFFIDENSSSKQSTEDRKPYSDSVPDFATSVEPSTHFVANQFMSAAQKAIYLSSPEWQTKRQAVLQRDNYCCQVCNSTINLQVHHIRYNSLGDEPLEDLVTLCEKHHQQLHDELGYDRETTFDFSTLKNQKSLNKTLRKTHENLY